MYAIYENVTAPQANKLYDMTVWLNYKIKNILANEYYAINIYNA